MLFLFAEGVWGLAVGITPDRLVFESQDSQQTFRIVNPNDAAVLFELASEKVACEPQTGKIDKKSSAQVRCIAKPGSVGEDLILVETKPDGGEESVGVIPAVAVKATIMGEQDYGEQPPDKGAPLTIKTTATEPANRMEGEGLSSMKTEIATIILLTAAIIAVLAHSEIKRRREERKEGCKNKTNTDTEPNAPADACTNPQQEGDQNTHQGSGHHGCGSPSGTSGHNQSCTSGSSVSPQS